MKKLKKMVAVLLTVVMAMAMGVTVFAADAKATLKVTVGKNNTLENQTVKIYKLFDLTESADSQHYSYTVNSEYNEILKEILTQNQDNATSEDYYKALSQMEATEIQSFAESFSKKAISKKATAEQTKIEKDTKEITFDNLDYGYYLVYQTGTKKIQSSLVMVDKPNVEVELKGEAPSIEKKADKTTVNIGDTVTYTITGTIPDTTGYDGYQYIIHDELTSGLTFKTSGVTIQIGNGDSQEVDNANFAEQMLTLDLSKWVRDNQEHVGETFTVTYQATVNEKAVVTEENKATLEYGHDANSTTTTTPKEAKTPTFPLQIKKVESGKTTMLAGATFRLYKNKVDADSDTVDKAIKVTGDNGKYIVAPEGTERAFTDIVSIDDTITGIDAECNLYLNGLAAGEYYLVETEAPAGYNKISGAIKVTITAGTADNTWTLTTDGNNNNVANNVLTVENSTGTILPSTGGTGTIIFSIVAGVLILGVAASFIKDRKKEA